MHNQTTLRDILSRPGVNQSTIAQLLGISKQAVSIMAKKNKLPAKWDHVVTLSKHFNIPLETFECPKCHRIGTCRPETVQGAA